MKAEKRKHQHVAHTKPAKRRETEESSTDESVPGTESESSSSSDASDENTSEDESAPTGPKGAVAKFLVRKAKTPEEVKMILANEKKAEKHLKSRKSAKKGRKEGLLVFLRLLSKFCPCPHFSHIASTLVKEPGLIHGPKLRKLVSRVQEAGFTQPRAHLTISVMESRGREGRKEGRKDFRFSYVFSQHFAHAHVFPTKLPLWTKEEE